MDDCLAKKGAKAGRFPYRRTIEGSIICQATEKNSEDEKDRQIGLSGPLYLE
jgi:hypothetical protein